MSIHHRNIQILATEIFRLYTGSATNILNEVFLRKPASNYNLSNEYELTVRPIKTAHYGLSSLAYLGLRIWKLLINNLKRIESVEALNLKLKTGYLKTIYAVFVNHISTK